MRPSSITQSESDAQADLHVAKRHLAGVVHHGNAVQILQFLHGALRHEQRPRLGFEQQPRPAVLARPQQLLRIGKRSSMPRVPVVGSTARSTVLIVPVCGYTVPSASVS